MLKLWKETGKTHHPDHPFGRGALLLGERLMVIGPPPGRLHKEYRLDFADIGVGQDLREIKKHPDFAVKRRKSSA